MTEKIKVPELSCEGGYRILLAIQAGAKVRLRDGQWSVTGLGDMSFVSGPVDVGDVEWLLERGLACQAKGGLELEPAIYAEEWLNKIES